MANWPHNILRGLFEATVKLNISEGTIFNICLKAASFNESRRILLAKTFPHWDWNLLRVFSESLKRWHLWSSVVRVNLLLYLNIQGLPFLFSMGLKPSSRWLLRHRRPPFFAKIKASIPSEKESVIAVALYFLPKGCKLAKDMAKKERLLPQKFA